MAHPPGIRRSPVSSSSTRRPQMLGTVLLGLAAFSSGCGSQPDAAAVDPLQTLTQANSMVTGVTVYANPNYEPGEQQTLSPGWYGASTSANNLNFVGYDTISSLQVPPGWRVTLYDGENFTGATKLITADTDLSVTGSFDNLASSVVVEGPVTIFQNDHFGPPSQYLPVGSYDPSRLTFGARALTSLRVAPGWKVTLYSGANFTGTARVVTSDKDFWPYDSFNDQTSSIKVEGPAQQPPPYTSSPVPNLPVEPKTPPVIIYQNDHYGAPSQNLITGSYDTSQLTFGDNALTSVRIVPGWKVTLYSNPGFTGTAKVLTSNTDLWPYNTFNDQTSSIKVEGPVTIYKNAGFMGPSQNLLPGGYNPEALTFDPRSLTSLKVAPGWKVTLYSDSWYMGESRVITSDTDLTGDGFDDRAMSVLVEGPVTLYKDTAYTGMSQGLLPGRYDWEELTFDARNLTSLKVAPGWKVTLYSERGFTGESRLITADADLTGDSFDNKTGSVLVEAP